MPTLPEVNFRFTSNRVNNHTKTDISSFSAYVPSWYKVTTLKSLIGVSSQENSVDKIFQQKNSRNFRFSEP